MSTSLTVQPSVTRRARARVRIETVHTEAAILTRHTLTVIRCYDTHTHISSQSANRNWDSISDKPIRARYKTVTYTPDRTSLWSQVNKCKWTYSHRLHRSRHFDTWHSCSYLALYHIQQYIQSDSEHSKNSNLNQPIRHTGVTWQHKIMIAIKQANENNLAYVTQAISERKQRPLIT